MIASNKKTNAEDPWENLILTTLEAISNNPGEVMR